MLLDLGCLHCTFIHWTGTKSCVGTHSRVSLALHMTLITEQALPDLILGTSPLSCSTIFFSC